ncbi:hypothetical protein PV327_011292 [Microctonus hyperodae]|uniref:Uncharacterized protein n=1 Tax=Microctonus hyperodae TaxID=165561 RepID=A0AA39ESU7_MICHY|nr:hypothetical protein PV327_011292 [Microctonus hyperodae]
MGRRKGKINRKINIKTTGKSINDERLVIDTDTEDNPPMNSSSLSTLVMDIESSSDSNDGNDHEMPKKNFPIRFLPYTVTSRDIEHMEKLLEILKYTYESQQKNQNTSSNLNIG